MFTQSPHHLTSVVWYEINQPTADVPLKQPLLIIYVWADGQMRRADKGDDGKREECSEYKRAAEKTNDGWEGWKQENDRAERMQHIYLWWIGTITTITVLQQRLDGPNEYKWEDLRPKSEDCLRLFPAWSIPPLIQDTEWLICNLPQGHKHLNASLQCNPEDFCCSLETLGGVKRSNQSKKNHLSQFRISFT